MRVRALLESWKQMTEAIKRNAEELHRLSDQAAEQKYRTGLKCFKS